MARKPRLLDRFMTRSDAAAACACVQPVYPGITPSWFVSKIGVCTCRVLELRGRVVGVIVYRVNPTWVRLDLLAVHPAYRRRGYASFFLTDLKAKVRDTDRRYFRVIVPESRRDLQACLRANNIPACEVVPDCFRNPADDGYVFFWWGRRRLTKKNVSVTPLQEG